MTIAPADLIDPVGPLETRLFPGEDGLKLTARAQAYLDAAYDDPRLVAVGDDTDEAEALQDQMARAYALWRAYGAVFQRMVNEPNAVNVGTEKGSHAYTDKQRDEMKALRDGYLAELLALVPVPITATSIFPGTTSVPTRFRW